MIFDRLYIAPKEAVRAREAVLKQDLYGIRTAIDQYTQDKGKAPQELNDIVSAGYLRAIPKDPFTNTADSWQVVQEDILTPIEQTPPGITDVKSGSTQISSEGNAYSDW
jgi:general secretion pathway protein G